ncbi:MAG: S24 family peptidase [candidate division WOR-3 bacterium]
MRDKGETIGARIKRAREHRGMSQLRLARQIGVPFQRISEWERGLVSPSARYLKAIADSLSVSLDWLLSGMGPMERPERSDAIFPVHQVPVYGTVPGGPPYDPGDPGVMEVIGVPAEYSGRDVFGLVVKGDSMSPTLVDGDRVLVARDIRPRDGLIVVVKMNQGEYTVKRMRRQGDLLILMPDNPNFQPIVLAPDDEGEIVGVVVEVIRRLL